MGKDDANDGWKPAAIEPIGHWVQSHNGRVIPLPSFDCPEAITLCSTAWVLAGINRFGARTVESYYNVAHHSVLVARLVRDLGGTVLEQFQALNHEGDESLLGFDPPAPLVRVCPDLRRLKHTAHVAYCKRYGLPVELPEVVKHADLVLLATEKRDLMAPCDHPWHLPIDPSNEGKISTTTTTTTRVGSQQIPLWGKDFNPMPDPLPEQIVPWDASRSVFKFVSMWADLAEQIGLPKERW